MIRDELGIKGGDVVDIRARLARQGIDASNVELYGGVGDSEKRGPTGRPQNRGSTGTSNSSNPYSGRKSMRETSRDAVTSAFKGAAAERIQNGNRKTHNIILGAHEEMAKSETAAPRAKNAFERHVAAMKLAAAYRGRIGRKKADTEKRKMETINQVCNSVFIFNQNSSGG